MQITFEEAYYQYLNYVDVKQKNQSKRTLKERFEKIILPYFKDYNIYELNEQDYIGFQSFINSKNYSYNYKRNIHFLISGFLKYCISNYGLEKNIVQNVGCFKKTEKSKEHNFYTYKDFKKFIKCVDNNIYKQFFNFMFFTGTRPGETMALRFSDLNDSYISITKTMDQHGKREVNSPKTLSSNRVILIDKHLLKELINLKKNYENEYKLKNYDYYIFGGIKPLSPTTINRYKKKACSKSGVKEITLHEFRHSHATLLMNRGILIHEISKRLGHNDVSITLNTYTHTDFKQEKRVIKTLNFLRLF